MYGINLIVLYRILVTSVVPNLIIGNNGIVKIIINNLIKYSAEQNMDMVKSMLNTLYRQDEKIYNEVLEILKRNFSINDLRDIID